MNSSFSASWFITCGALFLMLLTACQSHTVIPANHPYIEYQGRIDAQQPDQPALIWQGSKVAFNFVGRISAIQFSDLHGSAYFDLIIDGKNLGILEAKNEVLDVSAFTNVPSSSHPHSLQLIKRSEASAGYVRLNAITLAGKIMSLASTESRNKPTLLFYGDSITAGACNEDGLVDQWDNRSTHNGLLSYAAITAEKLGANYQNMAISGLGISTGYQTYTASQVWNRLYPDPSSPLAELTKFQPDVVFINLGENDDSFTLKHNQPFPADYSQRYLTLLHNMRSAYPQSKIVILRGGMGGGANSKRLLTPLNSVVTQFLHTDTNAYHFVFTHWSPLHPRVADHAIMATELLNWLHNKHWF